MKKTSQSEGWANLLDIRGGASSASRLQRARAELLEHWASDVWAWLTGVDTTTLDCNFPPFEHFDNGRPIIIAAHSQGTSHALRLLKDFFEHTNLKNRLVVAYVPGVAIPGNYFTNLPLCKTPTQTGCVCGWRTYRTGYVPDWIKKEQVKSWVVNPITWTDTDTMAGRNLNKGSVLRKFNKKRFHVAGAHINEGVLWTDRPRFPLSFLIPLKDYHIGDINFYYFNIRDNVHTRVGAFWKR